MQPIKHCDQCNAPRKTDICTKCGSETHEPAAGWEYPDLPDIDKIRALAREVGYAIGVHGTLERDLDLIAVPWVEDAVGNQALMEHIAAGMNARILQTERKPRSRYAASIQIDGWYKTIDLSVVTPPPQ